MDNVLGTCETCGDRIERRHALWWSARWYCCRCWRYVFPTPGLIMPDTLITPAERLAEIYYGDPNWVPASNEGLATTQNE